MTSILRSSEIVYFRPLLLFVLLGFAQSAWGQATPFVNACIGKWQGTMYLFKEGQLRDSVRVRLSVATTPDPKAWSWKTEYLSAKTPMTKDYTLRLKDAEKHVYVTDEGGGVELYDYLFGNKLYCVFETGGIMLTSSYELRGDELIFEVSSGKKVEAPSVGVVNYATSNLQRVVFRRIP
jgi:hypothetical protein